MEKNKPGSFGGARPGSPVPRSSAAAGSGLRDQVQEIASGYRAPGYPLDALARDAINYLVQSEILFYSKSKFKNKFSGNLGFILTEKDFKRVQIEIRVREVE